MSSRPATTHRKELLGILGYHLFCRLWRITCLTLGIQVFKIALVIQYTQNFTITNVKVSLQESQGFSLLQVLSNQDTYQSDIPVNMNPYGPKLHTDIYISQGSSEQ